MKIQLSEKGKGMPMPVKTIFPLFITCFTIAFTSCKKENAVISPSMSATQSSNAVASDTKFGALLSGNTNIDDEIKVCEKLGVSYVRYAIILKDFTGIDKGYEKWVNAGYKVLLNLNYDNVSNISGKKTPVPFPTDMVEYKKLLEKVLDKYHPEIAVIENEPTTDQFHSGPIENYITMLKTAVDVCKARGINVTDGSVHADWVETVMNGWVKETNSQETKKLIEAYKTIDLTYVNTHAKGPFNSNQNVYPDGALEDVADYLRAQTGKQVICNEYNQHNNSTTLMTGAVGGFKNGGYKYVIARSGSGDQQGASLNKGTNLTALGIAYRDAIQ